MRISDWSSDVCSSDLCPERTCHGGLQKGGFAAELAKIRAALPKGTPVEIWFQDEARIGQKNKITRRWARRGTRPSAPKDQRTKSAYVFGAICPEHGKGAGPVDRKTVGAGKGVSVRLSPGGGRI